MKVVTFSKEISFLLYFLINSLYVPIGVLPVAKPNVAFGLFFPIGVLPVAKPNVALGLFFRSEKIISAAFLDISS